MVISVLLIVFAMLNVLGILPFYSFPGVRYVWLPAAGIGLIAATVYVVRLRKEDVDPKTREQLERLFGSPRSEKSSVTPQPVPKLPPVEPKASIETSIPKAVMAKPIPPGYDRTSGQGIMGTWRSPKKDIKMVFLADNKVDILYMQSGGTSTYLGGTYRKDERGHYWIRPEMIGTTKITAKPIKNPEMEFILDGARLLSASDTNVQFFRG